MAFDNFDSRPSTELLIPKHKFGDDKSQIKSNSYRKFTYDDDADDFALAGKLVPVVYYISRNGKLEHPHFVLVAVSSSDGGLYLRDVLNRLNVLRGNSMAYKYSWSSKRKYKSNGYVWQDLSEDDLIHPTNDHDYVLKGSEIPQNTHSFRLQHKIASPPNDVTQCDISSITSTRKTQSWTHFQNMENHRNEENRIYKCTSSRQLGEQLADAATQTDDDGGRRRWRLKEEYGSKSMELSREEFSPPPSMSSSDGMDGGSVSVDLGQLNQTVKNECSSWRIAQRRLMQLISCRSSDSTKCYNSTESLQQEFLRRVYKPNNTHRSS